MIDTNILAYYINGTLETELYETISAILTQPFHVNATIKIELLGWKGYLNASDVAAQALIENAIQVEQTEFVVHKAIKLRRHYPLKLGDAIIAATALVYDLVLVTRNTKDFARIEGLRLLNPFEQDK